VKLHPEIINLLQDKSGYDLTISHSCVQLAQLITDSTGRNISASTMRRLLGFYNEERQPQQFTLDAIALYLGYVNWDELIKSVEEGLSGFKEIGVDFDSNQLQTGQTLRLTYRPNRILCLSCLGNSAYLVQSCQGSTHLQPGDILIIRAILKGFPLICQSVTRDGQILGAYSTAETVGIDKIEVE